MTLTTALLTGNLLIMNIALIYTPDTDDASEAIRQAEALAEGLGTEGENISVLGQADGEWIAGGDEKDSEVLIEALNGYIDALEGFGTEDQSRAVRMIETIRTARGE